MAIVVDQTAVLNEGVWSAWIQKGRLQERASMRKLKISGGFFLALLAAGIALYSFAGR